MVTITLSNDLLLTDEEAAEMTDAEIIALACEDWPALVDGARWTIERKQS